MSRRTWPCVSRRNLPPPPPPEHPSTATMRLSRRNTRPVLALSPPRAICIFYRERFPPPAPPTTTPSSAPSRTTKLRNSPSSVPALHCRRSPRTPLSPPHRQSQSQNLPTAIRPQFL